MNSFANIPVTLYLRSLHPRAHPRELEELQGLFHCCLNQSWVSDKLRHSLLPDYWERLMAEAERHDIESKQINHALDKAYKGIKDDISRRIITMTTIEELPWYTSIIQQGNIVAGQMNSLLHHVSNFNVLIAEEHEINNIPEVALSREALKTCQDQIDTLLEELLFKAFLTDMPFQKIFYLEDNIRRSMQTRVLQQMQIPIHECPARDFYIAMCTIEDVLLAGTTFPHVRRRMAEYLMPLKQTAALFYVIATVLRYRIHHMYRDPSACLKRIKI